MPLIFRNHAGLNGLIVSEFSQKVIEEFFIFTGLNAYPDLSESICCNTVRHDLSLFDKLIVNIKAEYVLNTVMDLCYMSALLAG